eukprot:1081619-Pelagomonas_calceolata.AAC.1
MFLPLTGVDQSQTDQLNTLAEGPYHCYHCNQGTFAFKLASTCHEELAVSDFRAHTLKVETAAWDTRSTLV